MPRPVRSARIGTGSSLPERDYQNTIISLRYPRLRTGGPAHRAAATGADVGRVRDPPHGGDRAAAHTALVDRPLDGRVGCLLVARQAHRELASLHGVGDRVDRAQREVVVALVLAL